VEKDGNPGHLPIFPLVFLRSSVVKKRVRAHFRTKLQHRAGNTFCKPRALRATKLTEKIRGGLVEKDGTPGLLPIVLLSSSVPPFLRG
jgi:hypothetical protein